MMDNEHEFPALALALRKRGEKGLGWGGESSNMTEKSYPRDLFNDCPLSFR